MRVCCSHGYPFDFPGCNSDSEGSYLRAAFGKSRPLDSVGLGLERSLMIMRSPYFIRSGAVPIGDKAALFSGGSQLM